MDCCKRPPEVREAEEEEEETVPAAAPVRTAHHPPVPAAEALEMLRRGNQRYVEGCVQARGGGQYLRSALATQGQNPAAVIIACADSRCPIELLFDARPGDLFVLRNAGNTCTHGEGSIMGSVEYSTGHLNTHLVLVLGHTKCGAVKGATATMLAARDAPPPQKEGCKHRTALEVLLESLAPVAQRAEAELPRGASAEEIAAHAVKVNVIHTMDRLVECSVPLRERVRRREVQIHGAIYDLTSGRVDFIGQSPNLGRLADSQEPPPVPSRFLPKAPAPATEDTASTAAASAAAAQSSSLAASEPAAPAAAAAPAAKGRVSRQFSRWYQHLRK